ncbi:MAG: hypothetical protein U0U69_12170 [Acidimicrobiia bacterium]
MILCTIAACGGGDAQSRAQSTTTAAADDPTAVPSAGTVAVAGGYTVVFTDPSLARVPQSLSAQAERVQAATIISPRNEPVAVFVLITPKVGTVLTDAILAQVLASQFGAAPRQISVAGKAAFAATSGDGTVVIARVNEDGVLAMFVGYPGVDAQALTQAIEAVTAVPAGS